VIRQISQQAIDPERPIPLQWIAFQESTEVKAYDHTVLIEERRS
jgi:hypothetical protein